MVQHADIDHTGIPGVPAGGGSVTYDHLTADEAGATTASLANTGLSFAVTNGTYYRFSFQLVWRSTSTSVGLKLGLTTPTFTAFVAGVRISLATATALTAGEAAGSINASGGSVTAGTAEAANQDYPATVEGIILPSADGTLMLQYAAETTGATVTLKRGSAGTLTAL